MELGFWGRNGREGRSEGPVQGEGRAEGVKPCFLIFVRAALGTGQKRSLATALRKPSDTFPLLPHLYSLFLSRISAGQ